MTERSHRGYPFTVTKVSDWHYTVDFPDFPSIITSSESETRAILNACEALDLHLETLARLKSKAPAVSSEG